MMERKEIIKNILIIFSVIILLIIPWASVIGIQDPGLLGAFREFQRSAGFVLITVMVLRLIYQIYGKPLAQEMKEEEIKETDQKEKKQLLFKPTFGVSIFYMFFILLSVIAIIFQFMNHDVNFGLIIVIFGMIVFFIWSWNLNAVFIFAEDSVQIQSYLIYLFGIDRKTIFRYADITSVCPDAEIKGNMFGVDSRHRMLITLDGTTQAYSLIWYNPEKIAKIYLRFREKLGDKVAIP